MSALRPGVRLGLDVGRARVGVARTDAEGRLASPLTTLNRQDRSHLRAVVDLVRENAATEVVVGLPLSLDGGHGPAAREVEQYAADLVAALQADGVDVDVLLLDERFTTVTATRELASTGVGSRDRRSRIDAHAASLILTHALDIERGSGQRPGTLVPTARG